MKPVKLYAVLLGGELAPPEGATELRLFTSLKDAREWANEYSSYDFAKNIDVRVQRVTITSAAYE